jgi:hypothetical protein
VEAHGRAVTGPMRLTMIRSDAAGGLPIALITYGNLFITASDKHFAAEIHGLHQSARTDRSNGYTKTMIGLKSPRRKGNPEMGSHNPERHNTRKAGYARMLAIGVLPAAVILGTAGAASAATGSGTAHQGRAGHQSNSTSQRSEASARTTQISPALNLSILSSGDQNLRQSNNAGSTATSGNHNATGQNQHQTGHGSTWGHRNRHETPRHGQTGHQSNSTNQRSEASARTTQISPALNLSILSSGDQNLRQNNNARSTATSRNHNTTRQNQTGS